MKETMLAWYDDIPYSVEQIVLKCCQKAADRRYQSMAELKIALEAGTLAGEKQNNKEVAGQTVFHFHMHLIPRYEGDGQHILWEPTEPTPEELVAIKEQLV